VADKTVTYDIVARDRSSKTLNDVGKGFGGLGDKAKSVGKGMALALGGAALGGVAALSVGLVQGVKDAAAYETLQKKTAAVLKSTGNAAHQSVKGIDDRAGALESLSGVDETLIINGQNVLATFTAVQDRAGKGNDVFTQATKTALDMSVALGSDLQGANIQLGKALNDPIKGIGALSKVGVSFTQQQKDQIKTLVKSGDTLGAQKVILKELNKEFGGAAKAAGSGFEGSLARVQDTISDFGRTVGQAVLPMLTRLFVWLSDKLPKAIAWLQKTWASLGPKFVAAGLMLWGVLQKVGAALVATGKFIIKYRGWIIPVVGAIVAMVAAWRIYVTVTKVITAVTKTYAAAQALLNVVMAANPIGIVIIAIIGLVAAFVIAYRRSETFRAIVNAAFHAVVAAGQAMWHGIQSAMSSISSALSNAGNAVKNVLQAAFRIAVRAILGYLGFIINGAARAFGWIPGIGPKLRAAAAAFNRFAASVNASLARIHNKQVTVTIRKNTIEYSDGRVRSRSRNAPNTMRAGGGGLAIGVAYQVNEEGQELLRLNDRSATVIPHAQSRRMLAGTGGGMTVIVNVAGSVIRERDLARTVSESLQALLRSGTYVGLKTT
jgi:phage-related protein